jgi:hypothetical protein
MPIGRWSAGDGICDCCDGSDELSNPHSRCPNTCGAREAERQSLLAVLIPIFADGVAKQAELSASGARALEEAAANKTSIEQQLRAIREEKAKATPQPTDSQYRDEAQAVEDGPTTQTESEPRNETQNGNNTESETQMESENKTVQEEPEVEVEISDPDSAFEDVDAPWLTDIAYYGNDDAEDYDRRSSGQDRYDDDDAPYDPEAETEFGTPEPTTPPKDDWSPHYRYALSSEEPDDDSGLPETVISDLGPRITPLPQWQEVFAWA